jgi:putative membrane protein
MRVTGYLFIGIFFLLAGCSPEQRDDGVLGNQSFAFVDEGSEKKKVASLIAEAIEDRYLEIRLAELASTKSSNIEILKFAQDLANDHTNTITMLQALAHQRRIPVSTHEGKAANEIINELSAEPDRSFDKEWCEKVIATHKKALEDFKMLSEDRDDPAVADIGAAGLKLMRIKLQRLTKVAEELI